MTDAEFARVLSQQYPSAYRISRALCGAKVAERITLSVLRKSGKASERWRDEAAAADWVLHHTILECRTAMEESDANRYAAREPIEFRAFLTALLALPVQQREAFILSRCERLKLRDIAVAMDCSNTAAQQHLSAAETALNRLTGADQQRLMDLLLGAYSAAVPAAAPLIDSIVRRKVRRKWLGRFGKLILLGTVAALVYAAWYAHHRLDF